MIQRVQTIYLILACVALAFLFKFPFATSTEPVPHLMADSIYNIQDSPVLLGLVIGALLLGIAAIFLFKNRKLQSRLSILVIIASLFIPLVAVLLMVNEETSLTDASGIIEDQAGIYLPIVSLIFGFLAYRAISKDEKIVKSMDRLR